MKDSFNVKMLLVKAQSSLLWMVNEPQQHVRRGKTNDIIWQVHMYPDLPAQPLTYMLHANTSFTYTCKKPLPDKQLKLFGVRNHLSCRIIGWGLYDENLWLSVTLAYSSWKLCLAASIQSQQSISSYNNQWLYAFSLVTNYFIHR